MQTTDLKEYLQTRGIQVENFKDIQEYLLHHPDMLSITARVCEITRNAFDPSTNISLAVYIDPEINDRYLTLYIRQKSYDPTLMDEIEKVSEKSSPLLDQTSGRLLITTDFRVSE